MTHKSSMLSNPASSLASLTALAGQSSNLHAIARREGREGGIWVGGGRLVKMLGKCFLLVDCALPPVHQPSNGAHRRARSAVVP